MLLVKKVYATKGVQKLHTFTVYLIVYNEELNNNLQNLSIVFSEFHGCMELS